MVAYTSWDTAAVGSVAQETLMKESVADLLSNLFPTDTPLQQALEKIDMPREQMSFPLDWHSNITRTSAMFSASASFATTLAKPEGFTYTDTTPQFPRVLIGQNEIQGLQFAVSDSLGGTPMYGISDRFAYEALKCTQAVVNNFEHSFWWSPGNTAGAGTDLNTTGTDAQQVARQSMGLVHWIGKSGLQRSKIGLGQTSFTDSLGNNFGTGTANANIALNNASSWMYDAAGVALDDAMFKDNVMGQWYAINGRQAGAMGFCSPKIKNLFGRFSQTVNGPINERTIAAASKLIVDTVDYYETDFGVISLNLSRYLNIAGQTVTITQSTGSVVVPYDEVLLLIKPRYFKIGVRRPVYMSPLGKTFDGEKGLVRGEMGLLSMNPSGGVGVVNCIP